MEELELKLPPPRKSVAARFSSLWTVCIACGRLLVLSPIKN